MQNIECRPVMHVFICINERCEKESCAPTISLKMYKEVKLWVRSKFGSSVFVTKTGCLGFCNSQGGVMCVWPQGRFVKGLVSVEQMKRVIEQEANNLNLK